MRYSYLGVCALAWVAGCSAAPPPDPALTARLRVLEPALAHPDRERRRATIEALGAVGEAAAPVLVAALADETDPHLRQAEVRALGAAGGDAALAELARRAADGAEDAGVRLAAIAALTAGRADVALVAIAREPGPVGRAARLGLTVVGGEGARAFFRNAWDRLSLGRDDRRDVAAGLGRLARPEDAERVRSLARDADPVVRRVAAAALGRIGGPPDEALLRRLALHDPDPGVRRAAAIARYRLGSP